jgi:hypothetical protein
VVTRGGGVNPGAVARPACGSWKVGTRNFRNACLPIFEASSVADEQQLAYQSDRNGGLRARSVEHVVSKKY